MSNACTRAAAALATFLLLESPALAQTLGQGDDGGVSLWRVAAALVLCLCLAVAGGFVLRLRLSPSGNVSLPFVAKPSPRRLKLVETLRLKQQVDLCIVTIDGRAVLVVASDSDAHLLTAAAPDGVPWELPG